MILFTSSSYTRGRAGYGVYSATKAGVVNLAQALPEEWANHGVHTTCINPQRTRTPMRTAAFGGEPLDTLLDPEDVARVALKRGGIRSDRSYRDRAGRRDASPRLRPGRAPR